MLATNYVFDNFRLQSYFFSIFNSLLKRARVISTEGDGNGRREHCGELARALFTSIENVQPPTYPDRADTPVSVPVSPRSPPSSGVPTNRLARVPVKVANIFSLYQAMFV